LNLCSPGELHLLAALETDMIIRFQTLLTIYSIAPLHHGSAQAFGQHEALTTRLKHILDAYADGPGVISELIQNADDAGATEVRLMLDMTPRGNNSLLGRGALHLSTSHLNLSRFVEPCCGAVFWGRLVEFFVTETKPNHPK